MIQLEPILLHMTYHLLKLNIDVSGKMNVAAQIPLTAAYFCDMLPGTNFGNYFQFSVSCGNQSAGIFISNAMKTLFTEVTNVQFDGTFYTVPIQFCHLWTLFVAVQAHPTCYTLSDDI